MQPDYQSIPPSFKKSTKLNLPIIQQIKLEKRCKELGMSTSEYFIYLMEEYDGDHINTIINFRYNLSKRVKKGINQLYIKQLIKLQKQLDLILNRL